MKDKKEYQLSFDIVRVVAVLFVILTHTVQREMEAAGIPAAGGSVFFTALWVFPLVCNVLYIMLSGALLYPWREEGLAVYYRKRFVSVALPMYLCYAAFYAAGGLMGTSEGSRSVKGYLVNLITGDTPEAPYYWLICILFSVYLTVPFFRLLLKDISYRNLSVFMGILMSLLTVKYFFRLAGIEPETEIPLSDWLIVSIAGYWVSRQETRKYDRFLIAGGGIGAAFIMGAIWMGGDIELLSVYCCNQSPVCILEGMAVFAASMHLAKGSRGSGEFNRNREERRGRKLAVALLRLLSKYSYGMILMHWGVLCVVIRKTLHIASENGLPLLVVVALSFILNVLISLILSFFLNRFLLEPLQKTLRGIALR